MAATRRMEYVGDCVVCGGRIERELTGGPKPRTCSSGCRLERARLKDAERRGVPPTQVRLPLAPVSQMSPRPAASDLESAVRRVRDRLADGVIAAASDRDPPWREIYDKLIHDVALLLRALERGGDDAT